MSSASVVAPMRIGHGFDVHRLVAGRRLMLGGIHVPAPVGSLGHSDGDALLHALADALLGAACLGDLGGLFPDTDPAYRDADSLDLLAICAAHIEAAGLMVGNIDATIVLQQPRLAPFLQMMRQRIAQTLGIAMEQISIKAKTSEGLGYTGDGSGIAAYAVVILQRISA